MQPITTIYGDKARTIGDGDLFIAKHRFVEGRRIVEIFPYETMTLEQRIKAKQELDGTE